MQKHQIISAWDILTAVINKIDLPINIKMEAKQAADLLREAAEESLPKAGTQTATQLDERATKAEIIAQGNDLDMLAAVMPFLLERQEGARMYMDRPSEGVLQYLEAINKKIAELLNIF